MNRKTLFLLFLFAALCPCMNAQDIIVLRDGTTILSKVLKIGTTEVEYKKFSNLEGPLYTVEKHTILAINFENGEKETFSDTPAPAAKAAEPEGPQEVKVPAADNNTLLIANYNEILEPLEKEDKDKEAKVILCQYGVTHSSVLANKEIEVSVSPLTHRRFACCSHTINIKNNTDKIIYVDLGNTFRVNNTGDSYAYFDTSKQTTVSKGGSSGLAMNAGAIAGAFGVGGVAGTLASGLTVGGGKQTTTSTTYTNQRVIAIGPHGTKALSTHTEIEPLSYKREPLSHGEMFFGVANIPSGTLNMGESKQYTEENTPWKTTYSITYSTHESFATYTSFSFSIFLAKATGLWKKFTRPGQMGIAFRAYPDTHCPHALNEWIFEALEKDFGPQSKHKIMGIGCY